MQQQPKYFYTTLHVSKGGGVSAIRNKSKGSIAKLAQDIASVIGFMVNQWKIKQEMDRLEPEIDEYMSTDGGVLVQFSYAVPPLVSGNSHNPMFQGASIAGYGCSEEQVIKKWESLQKLGTIRPYYGEGWTWETSLVWVTSQ
ncbi:hypothetical protein [Paracoccus onubensis]|uniref:Uncharacterized protein n=1 Tax=Paracoccus onubensis TaxID=1675788 RepID=A0A418SSZ2_9RHOB|nr:hypothetical protein [Paracoccus onubensis]RJE84019.1 hypothetical protein D3P04_13460 [Paracoccus onubensis]